MNTVQVSGRGPNAPVAKSNIELGGIELYVEDVNAL